jgi:hypothetical protein
MVASQSVLRLYLGMVLRHNGSDSANDRAQTLVKCDKNVALVAVLIRRRVLRVLVAQMIAAATASSTLWRPKSEGDTVAALCKLSP